MRKIVKKIVLIILLLLLIGGVLFVGIGFVNYVKATDEVSITEKVATIREKKHYVRYDDINENLFKATVAIEDRRFYTHHGVEYRSMMRAALQNIFANSVVGGGSTITQQLAKNLYFDYQPSYIRKVSEIFVAYDLEKKLSKKDILELYVNVINYGDNHIGIYEAAQGYFHKDPKDLTLNEATLLAGLPQSPSNYQLSNHYDNAKIRQQQVLEAMVDTNVLTSSKMQQVLNQNKIGE